MRVLELLAPARDLATARQAILHGADAVYIGAGSHGARAAAANDTADIARLAEYAHIFGVRVYVTLNTIVYDSELAAVRRLVRELYRAGVDALIVQDMSLLQMPLPPIDLHASTQCDIRTPAKAQFLAGCGCSQLVLPREMSLAEIRAVREAVPGDVALEAFVHGALCVSYSGDCQASRLACGRSANRGECAQICRLPYTLTDRDGNPVTVGGRPLAGKHLLSLRDLCRIGDIEALADAGISSFKIEGRLKDEVYVKHTVGAYRRAIDEVIAAHPDRYCRPSRGRVSMSFTPDVSKVFNRGFTRYFTDGCPPSGTSMASFDTPKWVGLPVGTVTAAHPRSIDARLTCPLNNGDGIGYFASDGTYRGFRLNRIDGNTLYPAPGDDRQWSSIPRGTTIYRNCDTKASEAMARDTATRLIPIDMRLSVSDCHGSAGEADTCTVTLSLSVIPEPGTSTGNLPRCSRSATIKRETARTPQQENRRRALSKIGGTPFVIDNYTDDTPDCLFVPASLLSALRRDAVSLLQHTILATHPYCYRRAETPGTRWPENLPLTYHDNVANLEAETFYRNHGATPSERAIELADTASLSGAIRVMTTKYCLRRELGACLRQPSAIRLPSPLYITATPSSTQRAADANRPLRYRLDFDCQNCRMSVIRTP